MPAQADEKSEDKVSQNIIHDGPDQTQRMSLGNAIIEIDIAEKIAALTVVTTHQKPPIQRNQRITI
jgi:hypothetical protein